MKSIRKNNKGFTLLEIIIVIIIIGVLASLALPRFFKTVEYSRASEALSALSTLRQAMDRCYLIDGAFDNCTMANLDVEDPSQTVTGNPNGHWDYAIQGNAGNVFTIVATRNAIDGGTAGQTITIDQDGTLTGQAGTPFEGIR